MEFPALRSAVNETGSVNPGYVALMVVLGVVVMLLIFMCALAGVAVTYSDKHAIDLGEFAKAVALTLGAFAAFLPALGGYVWMDRKGPQFPQGPQ
jgi:purine-cytosine permease-like protein